MSIESITQIIVLTAPIIWIAWDLYAYLKAGNASTESANMWKWTVRLPGIAFLVGILCGHFFFQMHMPTEFVIDDKGHPIWRAGVDLKAGQILTVDVNGDFIPK